MDGALSERRRQVEAIEPLRPLELRLPRAQRTLDLLLPADLDPLIDAVEHDPEQNLPYWAELWPSGIALADAVLAAPKLVRGRRVLELGCGLGVTACAALYAGAELTVADYAPEALAFCRYHALLNTGREPAALRINWRAPSAELLAAAGAGFDALLAADVLYESRDVQPLLNLLERLLAPGGLLWLAEPGRAVARRFVELSRARGWEGPCETHPGPWPDPRDDEITVSVYRLRRPGP